MEWQSGFKVTFDSAGLKGCPRPQIKINSDEDMEDSLTFCGKERGEEEEKEESESYGFSYMRIH